MSNDRRKQERQAARNAGYQAFLDGKSQHCGPKDGDGRDWKVGWYQAQEDHAENEAAKKDEQLRADRVSPIPLGVEGNRKAKELFDRGVSRPTALRAAKKEVLLSVVANGDDTDLRRVVAELVRRMPI